MTAMDLPTCQVPPFCRETVPPGYSVCDPHGSELTRVLISVVGMEDALEDAAAKTQRFSVARRGTSTRDPGEAPIPIRTEAVEAARALRAALIQACEWIAAARRIQPPRRDSPAGELARWIVYSIPWIRHQDDGPDMYARLVDVVRTAAHTMDRPADLTYLGPCDHPTKNGTDCGEDLYAPATATILTCYECGTTYDLAELRERRLAQAEDRTGTPTEIAGALAGFGVTVTIDTIKNWRTAGKLTTRGTNRDGRPVYRVGDVLTLAYVARARRLKAAARRTRRARTAQPPKGITP